ncbi:ankyrin [Colletotrichum sublineola]|nr:ankyrin [Colletotrichum sublineola]
MRFWHEPIKLMTRASRTKATNTVLRLPTQPYANISSFTDTSLELLQLLHEHGTKMTPRILGESIRYDQKPVTEWLLSLNIDLKETAFEDESWSIPFGRTPMQAAAEQGNIALFERILTLGADMNEPPSTNDGGVTALQAASIKGYFGLVSKMLDLHADPNAPGAEIHGRTALEGAAEHGRLDIVQILLNSGVQTYGNGRRQYVRSIEFARWQGHHAVVTLLKSHRPWTEADQELLEDNTLFSDQTSEGIARWLERLDNSSVEDEDEYYQDEDIVTESFEGNKEIELIDAGSEVHEDDPEEAHILLPLSTLEEIRETPRDGDEASSLPGDAIWAEEFERWTSKHPWLLE